VRPCLCGVAWDRVQKMSSKRKNQPIHDDGGYRDLLAPETRERLEALLDFRGRQEELTKKRRKEIQASHIEKPAR